MSDIDLNRFIEKFKDDSLNLLNELEGKLLELENDTENHDLIEAVFRAMHTLKGVGGMFGYNAISEYTHFLEGIYDKIREGNLKLTHNIFNVTFESVDHLRNLLFDKEMSSEPLFARQHFLIKKIENILIDTNQSITNFSSTTDAESVTIEKQTATWFIHFKCNEELLRRGINIVYLFEDVAKLGKFFVDKLETIKDSETDTYEENWGIYLHSEAKYSDIEDIFIFVSEYVKIIKASSADLLSSEALTTIPLNNTSKGKSIFEIAEKIGMDAETPISIPKVEPVSDSAPTELANGGSYFRKEEAAAKAITRISVGSDKLDKLMYLVSELFTTKSELMMASNAQDWERVRTVAEKVDKLSNQFRNNALNIRLVPVKELTLKFKRLIRDLSHSLNKKIEFETHGEDTELDKNLVDSLADPFMHIVRNCIDHGIETSEKRIANGKSDTGTIRFSASQTGNYIFIQISDDGNGINTEYIRKKAIEKGFLQPNIQLSKTEILDLIFLPGFSTAESLSQVSGRGVGMDVVKRAINDLRGSIQIDTKTNIGTTFTIKLQQTISIIDTLLIKTGNTYFTIHLEEIELCGLESHESLFDRTNSHWQLDNELIPFVHLRSEFNIQGEAPEIEKIVVVKTNSKRFAIITDEIIGQYQAVLKPIDDIVKRQEYITGASIVGDGSIALMLDTYKLMKTNKMAKHETIVI